VTHACNPSYLGSWDWKDSSSQPAGKKVRGTPISTNSWAQWLIPVIPNCYIGRGDWEDHRGSPGQAKMFARRTEKLWTWWYTPVIPSCKGSVQIRGLRSRPAWTQSAVYPEQKEIKE
jgi:hypothetical protein